MNKILIAEDERAIAELLSRGLERSGYKCTVAFDGEQAADFAEKESFDIALLDVMMPKIDGYELLEYLRQMQVPVIFITAKSTLGDKVKGLRLGADDYILKPFEMPEIIARTEAVLRRAGKGGNLLSCWNVKIDITAHKVYKDDKELPLTPMEFCLLEQLLRNRGAAMYREVLYERVWGGEMNDTRTLDLHIQRLRKKLDWSWEIETVYKVGYMLKEE